MVPLTYWLSGFSQWNCLVSAVCVSSWPRGLKIQPGQGCICWESGSLFLLLRKELFAWSSRSLIRSLLPMQETRIWFLGWEDPLEKEMSTHSSILAWRIPWTEKPGGLLSMESQRVGQDWTTNTFFTFTLSPSSPVVKTLCSQYRGPRVAFFVRELDPTCRN